MRPFPVQTRVVPIRQLLPAAVLAFCCASLLGCYEEPSTETLTITVTEEGALELGLLVRLAPLDDVGQASEPAVRERQQEIENRYLDGYDDWAPRFERIANSHETLSWHKRDGKLTRFERTATVTNPEDLGSFLADTGIAAHYEPKSEVQAVEGSIALFAGASTRATQAETEQVEAALEGWGRSVSRYVRQLDRLYRYLESRPERARNLFGSLLSERFAEEELLPVGPVEEGAEEDLLSALEEAMLEVLEILTPTEGRAVSMNELAGRVYDPFPANIWVELPGPATEALGFEPVDSTRYRVPRQNPVAALQQLAREWISVDPLSLWLEGELEPEAPSLNLDELSSRPRVLTAPSAPTEVLSALRLRLKPVPEYQLSW